MAVFGGLVPEVKKAVDQLSKIKRDDFIFAFILEFSKIKRADCINRSIDEIGSLYLIFAKARFILAN